jgi:hypothetical protein
MIEHPAPLRITNPFFDYLVKTCKQPASPKKVAAILESMGIQPIGPFINTMKPELFIYELFKGFSTQNV